MTDATETDESPTVLESLPNTPLLNTTIQALQQHDDIQECIPLYEYRTASNGTGVIAVLLKHNEATVIAVFNPDSEQWEDVFRTETFSNVYGDDATVAREEFTEKLGRVYELYDPDAVALLNPTESEMFALQENAFTNLLNGLPNTPISTETLKKFKKEADVVEVIPHLYLRDTNNAVFLSITFDDVIKNERRFGFTFFDKDAEEWVGSFSMDASRLNDPEDTEFEDAFESAFDVVEEAYGSHVLGSIETEADYRDWIPGTPVRDETPRQS